MSCLSQKSSTLNLEPQRTSGNGERGTEILLSALIALLVTCILVLAYVPPVSRDALTHHLAVPKLYLQHGGIYEIPEIAFSYYPMNLDLLYMIPLYLGSDIAPKFIHFAFALLTAWLIYAHVRRRLGRSLALLAVLMFLSLPVVVKLSTTVYVDLAVIFFSTAAILSLLRWVESGFRPGWLALSAVSCGLCMGTKYNGLVLFFLLALFVPFLHVRRGGRASGASVKALGWGALFLVAALLVFSPWMVRNAAWKGNPIYPLYDSVFKRFSQPDAMAAPAVSETDAGEDTPAEEIPAGKGRQPAGKWTHFDVRRWIYQESPWQIALVPLRIFFEGRDDTPKYFDGRLNPYLLFFPFLAFAGIRKDPPEVATEKKVLLAFSVLFIVYAFFQVHMRIRYIAPVIPPLVILSVYGVGRLFELINGRCTGGARTVCKGAAVALVCLSIAPNAVYVKEQFQTIDPFSYISGRLGRDEYISRFRPEYPAVKYANIHLPQSARILALFIGNRRYYFDREVTTNTGAFRNIVDRADEARQVAAQLKKDGITHLMVRYDLFDYWARSAFGEKKMGMVGALLSDHTRLLFSSGGFGLHQIL